METEICECNINYTIISEFKNKFSLNLQISYNNFFQSRNIIQAYTQILVRLLQELQILFINRIKSYD